jgi:hypothetical protein
LGRLFRKIAAEKGGLFGAQAALVVVLGRSRRDFGSVLLVARRMPSVHSGKVITTVSRTPPNPVRRLMSLMGPSPLTRASPGTDSFRHHRSLELPSGSRVRMKRTSILPRYWKNESARPWRLLGGPVCALLVVDPGTVRRISRPFAATLSGNLSFPDVSAHTQRIQDRGSASTTAGLASNSRRLADRRAIPMGCALDQNSAGR